MASTINAQITPFTAVVMEADDSGNLALQTNNVTALTINSSQVVSLAQPLPVSSGGTGATTQAAAAAAVLPTQTGNTGKYLTTDGANASWSTVTQTRISGGTTGLTPSTLTGGDVTLAGTLAVANGGTGLTSPGTSGNVLTSNGTTWTSTAPTLADGSVTDAKVANAVTGSSWFSVASISSSPNADCYIGMTMSAGAAKLSSVRVLRTGTYSIRLRASSSTTSYYRIYKNGAALSTELSVSGGYVTISWSGLSFTKGDLLQIYGRTGGQSGITSFQASCDSATTLMPIGIISANEGGYLGDYGIAL